LINGLKEAWEAHQTTGPKAIHTKIQGIIETDYLTILSRIAFESPELFVEALSKTQSVLQPPEKFTSTTLIAGLPIQWLIDEWISHCEDFGDPERRKLMTMALTKLLDHPQPILINHMQSLLNLWTNVITELIDELGNKDVDSLVWAEPTNEQWGNDSANDKRRNALARVDPVHTINLIELVRTCLGGFIQRCGGEQRFQEEVLVNVDKEVIAGFGALGII